MSATLEAGGDAPTSTQIKSTQQNQSFEIYSCTIREPPYAYARLRVASSDGLGASQEGNSITLDALQAHSFCTSALGQFLGLTGSAVSVDVLKVEGAEFWVRIPRQDLGRFSAAITAWDGPSSTVLRMVSCGDWLGSLLGRAEQQDLWSS